MSATRTDQRAGEPERRGPDVGEHDPADRVAGGEDEVGGEEDQVRAGHRVSLAYRRQA
jgi:hypothetical protein